MLTCLRAYAGWGGGAGGEARAPFGLERRHRQVHHRVTEQGALSLKGLNPSFELLLL
jgi:hypothetical protein